MSLATDVIEEFWPRYEMLWLSGTQSKLGIATAEAGDDEHDRLLARDWLNLLEEHAVDFTRGWRRLADAAEGKTESLEALFPSPGHIRPWLARWRGRLGRQAATSWATASAMRAVNPLYVPRNHLVEEALAAATDSGDLTLFERLLGAISKPYDERPGLDDYACPAPAEFTACYKTYCGT